jgi:bacterioferritin
MRGQILSSRRDPTEGNQRFAVTERWMPSCTLADGATAESKLSIDEMKHADLVIDRILFLEGSPSISACDKILVGATVKQQLENDLGLEQAALVVLHAGIKTCVDADDQTSKNLLEQILKEEESHVDWLESQLHQIKEVGYENYLAQQINP